MNKSTLFDQNRIRKVVVEIISALLLVFFIHTLVSTYIQFQSLKNLLGFYASNTTIVAWIIITIEGGIALLIFFPRTRMIGLVGSFLVSAFVSTIILRFPHYPHDFGGIFNQITDIQAWVIISIIIILSVGGISLIHRNSAETTIQS